MKPYYFDGARHFFGIVEQVNKHRKDLGPKCCKSLMSTLAENGLYGHSDMVIAAMLTDQNKNVQKNRYVLIEKSRQRHQQNPLEVRRLVLPRSIKKDAKTYVDLLPENESNIWEPPSTRELSDAKISELKDSHETIELPLIPCHSQHVEYHVQLMSDTAEKVNSHYVDGFILNKIKSRRHLQCYKRKTHFQPLCDSIIQDLSSNSLNEKVNTISIVFKFIVFFNYFYLILFQYQPIHFSKLYNSIIMFRV